MFIMLEDIVVALVVEEDMPDISMWDILEVEGIATVLWVYARCGGVKRRCWCSWYMIIRVVCEKEEEEWIQQD